MVIHKKDEVAIIEILATTIEDKHVIGIRDEGIQDRKPSHESPVKQYRIRQESSEKEKRRKYWDSYWWWYNVKLLS